MQSLSDDDLDLREMTEEELDAAWDLWFDLMQSTDAFDPPYTHGVFAYLTWDDLGLPAMQERKGWGPGPGDDRSASRS